MEGDRKYPVFKALRKAPLNVAVLEQKFSTLFRGLGPRKSGPAGSLTAGEGVYLATWREINSSRPLTMRVMPFLIRATLKLMSSPRR